MKIVLLGTAYPYRGGLASYNERLARELLREGHFAEILTFTLQYPGIFFPGTTQYSDSPAPEGLKIRKVLNSVNPLSWLKTGRLIRNLEPDILIIKYWHPFMAPCFGTVARIARQNRKKITRVICIFDNVIPHEKTFIDRMLTKYFTGSIDGAVVMSASVGDDLKTFRINIPVVMSPHPLYDNYGSPVSREEAIEKLKLESDFQYLLFFGFIRAYKGLDLLLNAFADARFRNRKIKLIVAGEFYESDAPYRSLIDNHGIADDVIMIDRFIREDEVAYLFCAAALVVQPYRSATQSGVTQIAYHFEKPMLVTDVGGLSEIVPDGKCGYVVKPEPSAIAEALDDFFSNNKMNQFAEGVREEKAKFAWDRLTRSVMKVYKGITR